jgi:hypothetical protein
MDSDATDHITGDLEKLTIYDKYSGNDHVHTVTLVIAPCIPQLVKFISIIFYMFRKLAKALFLSIV